ncbi:hypothetical protein [Flavobacterium psychrotrophum]|nr:hypothetical protein [Flavobacterium psychrotrophum]
MEEKKENRGGSRPGSGREPQGRKIVSFRLNDDEKEKVKNYIADLRTQKP